MKFFRLSKKIVFIVVGLIFLSLTTSVEAVNVGDLQNFYVDKGFDINNRAQVSSVLVKTTARLYFYVDKQWWDSQSQVKQNQSLVNLDNLSAEFDNNIYPKLTSIFGSEWNPGIDNDSRITVLFQPMNSTEGGYFREADQYDKLQLTDSNMREMVYLSTAYVDSPNAKIVLAHEFMHLVTFNQKNKILRIEEDTWLNEARADYSSTILGYNDNYNGSNLQQRAKDFVENPSDSITDWTGTRYDYASVSLFTHYLVDRYGVNVLADSLRSNSSGIESINQALLSKGAGENFSQIFTNWTIATVINDCSLGLKYCYSNQNLKNIRINPTLIFLPLTGNSSLSTTNVTKNWAGNWQKIIGGNGDLKLEFLGSNGFNFQVPYIVYDKENNYSVKFLTFDSNRKGVINIPNFGKDYKSLIIIPSLQENALGLNGLEMSSSYNYSITIGGNIPDENQLLIQQLLAQIEALRKQLADLLAQRGITTPPSCTQLNNNLYFGLTNNSEVSCLQQFLKNQGANIYPEGLVTGNFASLTRAAVIRFQEKYASEILAPGGFSKGTGYVGNYTRTKINQILTGG